MKTFSASILAALLLALPLSAQARPKGPLVLAGCVLTPERPVDGTTFHRMVGPTVKAGFEIGDFWNSEFSFQLTRAASTATDQSSTVDTTPTIYTFYTYAVGYQLTFDILRKGGFTPYLGAGLDIGLVHVDVDNGSDGWYEVNSYLEFHLVAGGRYTLKNGLGFRGEMALSTYGGFVGWMPSIGVTYQL